MPHDQEVVGSDPKCVWLLSVFFISQSLYLSVKSSNIDLSKRCNMTYFLVKNLLSDAALGWIRLIRTELCKKKFPEMEALDWTRHSVAYCMLCFTMMRQYKNWSIVLGTGYEPRVSESYNWFVLFCAPFENKNNVDFKKTKTHIVCVLRKCCMLRDTPPNSCLASKHTKSIIFWKHCLNLMNIIWCRNSATDH